MRCVRGTRAMSGTRSVKGVRDMRGATLLPNSKQFISSISDIFKRIINLGT